MEQLRMFGRQLRIFGRQLFGRQERHGLGVPDRAPQSLQHRIITLITWAMLISFGVSLLGIVGFPAAGRETPEALSQLLFATLGYFGGAFASFMRFVTPGPTPGA